MAGTYINQSTTSLSGLQSWILQQLGEASYHSRVNRRSINNIN